ncbi:hypothetical protein [Pelagicoccus enzymogenes]|uniref:hypothetical protein n=1 Tax=Pelagicoccus enzymogenes TaxID=2773457 RepID=UPI0021E51BEE|nr:hypothetical protein [Pelagicoccus enzymogenes]
MSFEAHFRYEELDIGFEPLAEARRKFGYEGNVLEKDSVPSFGEVGGNDLLFLGSVVAGEEELSAKEEDGDTEEDEEEDVDGVNGGEGLR